ncbi:hypothetical protein GLOTRDRAFT_112146 [Gloeophyllum trabeum ATCC 11539]|uniref:PHD-type domain-containing protein n=1 Tax=Gloeophyllum trabeum (strain ATCC 11539 / FP-39264 / Madison 617) TaxID=670483 RepID=S7PX51_GLOTA|nr:uncharacterized protein GLOTRDRAFT_112146 [Gloeophyllum trabeum ATCC 11539]EPQ52068.1 hypothetical protein GLOTRDRAFT_112146 [Gloeophyllum trabeum ATCC 11539]
MYQHLHNIIRDSPAGRDLLEHTSTSSESVNSTSLPDLTVVLPELLTRYERSQRDLHALRKERDALKNTMESDIGRLNQKISALQADIATLTNSASPESDETAVVDTRGSGPLRLKLKVAKQQDSEFQSALAEVHTSRASSVPPAASPRPSSSLPPHNSRNSVPVKVERAESVTSVRSTTSSRPRLSLTELRAMLAERMAGQAAAQTSMVTDNPEPLVSSASDPSVVSTHVADTTANEPPVPPMVDLRRYCVCDQLAYGEMIACDAPGCRQEWFHLACVGLSIAPEGAWQCLECSLSSGNHHLL